MASSTRIQQELTDKDTLFVGRFVYDVMMCTFSKCGLPETKLPTTDCSENVYNRANLVQIASASALWVALLMRDKWKPMLISRHKSTGFNDKEVKKLLGQLAICCPLSRNKAKQSSVEVFLAVCNEIFFFCQHESIIIDPIMLMKSTATYIIFLTASNRNISTVLEELFLPFNNISNYDRWITNFITGFAIPYGSRDDVSEKFAEHIKNQFKDVISKSTSLEELSMKNVMHLVGDLPHDASLASVEEGCKTVPENLLLATGSTLPGDRKSPEPPKLPESSKNGAEKGKK